MEKVLHIYISVRPQPLSHVRLFATPWTVDCQAPPSMGFSRWQYWSGLPFPSLGDLPDRAWVSCVSHVGRWVLYHWATTLYIYIRRYISIQHLFRVKAAVTHHSSVTSGFELSGRNGKKKCTSILVPAWKFLSLKIIYLTLFWLYKCFDAFYFCSVLVACVFWV